MPSALKNDTALIDLPKEDMMMFFNKHIMYQGASESKRPELLMDLLLYTYEKCGYTLSKALLDKEMIDSPGAKMIILASVMNMVSNS